MCLKRTILWLVVICCGFPGTSATQSRRQQLISPPTSFLNPVGAGARAAGRSFAFIGKADDATAASHNPGGLTQLENPEISAGGFFFLRDKRSDDSSDASFENQLFNINRPTFLSIVLPPAKLLGRKLVLSVQYQRPFELKQAVDATVPLVDATMPLEEISSDFSYRRNGSLVNIAPAVAMQVTKDLSVGVAFNIWPDFLPELFGNEWHTTTLLQLEALCQVLGQTNTHNLKELELT